MAICVRSKFIGNVYFNYRNYTIHVDGVSYEVNTISPTVRDELDWEQELEFQFMLLDYVRYQEYLEAERIKAIEDREKIIRLAATMSKIFRKRREKEAKTNKKRKWDDSSSS
ncbi:hypothetical protein POM88_014818 [Heracleum sosnowskyi]|uniref:Uncharacterized protein n=1 Tax=Heracleum sosnowskyi TaxID=360622 RepID=A0AAD8MRB7_9APIA|nr:hypothetical protein POM88_014818 [Heracleum sosnowskyi]